MHSVCESGHRRSRSSCANYAIWVFPDAWMIQVRVKRPHLVNVKNAMPLSSGQTLCFGPGEQTKEWELINLTVTGGNLLNYYFQTERHPEFDAILRMKIKPLFMENLQPSPSFRSGQIGEIRTILHQVYE